MQYNFHVRTNDHSAEGKIDLSNKVRVWTFCYAKVRSPPLLPCLHLLCIDVYTSNIDVYTFSMDIYVYIYEDMQYRCIYM